MNDTTEASDVDAIMHQAVVARELGDIDGALGLYKRALMLTVDDDVLDRAGIYVALGDLKRAQGKLREADSNFEKALALMPAYAAAIRAIVEMAEAGADWKRAVTYRGRLAEATSDPTAKAAEYKAIAAILGDRNNDVRGAVEALEKARDSAPADRALLEKLVGSYEKLQRWPKVVETLDAMWSFCETSAERGAIRFTQADIVLSRLREEPRGLAMLDAALEDDPSQEKALAALVAIRSRGSEWAEIEALYARLINLHVARGDADRAFEICKRLGLLRRDKLADGPGAVDALQGAVKLRPGDAEVRGALAELLVARGDIGLAISEYEQAAALTPTRPHAFRRLFELHGRAADADRSYLAALALEVLDAAEMDHDLIINQFKPEGRMQPAAALTATDWDTTLRASGYDLDVAAILRAIGPAAIKARVAELSEQKKLVALDPAKRQDASGTVTAVRAFAWAAQVLGIALPDLYVMDNVPGGCAAIQAGAPATAVGPQLLSGLGMQEIIYVAARHLAYYRPEHYPLVFFPTIVEFTQLFLTGLSLGLPDMPIPANDGVKVLRAAVIRTLGDAEREALFEAARSIERKGGRVDLAAYIRGVELTAHRAAFLLAGDAQLAVRRIASESRVIADVTADDRRGDLLAYLASAGLAQARARLGVSVSSTR